MVDARQLTGVPLSPRGPDPSLRRVRRAGGRRTLALALAVCLTSALVTVPAVARVLLDQEEALALAFPGAAVVRRTAYLDAAQVTRVRERSGTEVRSAVIPHYVATKDGLAVGVAYFDTHRVRTEAETLMIVVSAEGRIMRVEVIAFDEPPDYLARAAWVAQFEGRVLDRDLALKRGIRPMTGATLTARAITAASRRVLALHAEIDPLGMQARGAAGEAGGAEQERRPEAGRRRR